jgi:O-antigen/teichoic acid export membrane protein
MAFLNPVVLALNNDAAPRVSNDYANAGLAGLSRSVWHTAGIAFLITLPILATLVIFGAKLVTLMYGPRFAGAGPIVDLLALGVCFYAVGLAFPYGLLTLKRANVDFSINIVCVVCFLALGIWLIRAEGVFGAACSFLMVQTVALILRVVAFRSVVRRANGMAIEVIQEECAAWK